jgi:two-component system chemotaxis response regulator CheY
MKLLVVDDSSVIRNRIAQLATHPDLPRLEVIGTAKHGVEALEMARKHMPDVVTMDLTMPNMDGVTCIRGLVNMSQEMRILVVSALGDRKTALQAMTNGAHGFLHKPFTAEELVEGLQELLRD